SHWDQEFTTAGEESEDRSLRLALYRSMGRASQFVMRFERNRRVSELNPFDENVIVVSFGSDFGDEYCRRSPPGPGGRHSSIIAPPRRPGLTAVVRIASHVDSFAAATHRVRSCLNQLYDPHAECAIR